MPKLSRTLLSLPVLAVLFLAIGDASAQASLPGRVLPWPEHRVDPHIIKEGDHELFFEE